MPERNLRAESDPRRRHLRVVPAADGSDVVELSSDDLESIPDRSEINIARLIIEELRKAQPPGLAPRHVTESPRSEKTAFIERGGRPWWRLERRQAIVAASAFAVGWNVLIGSYLVLRAPSPVAETKTSGAVVLAAAIPACRVTTEAHLLARGVAQSGGIEASAFDHRLAFGAVKWAREGLAMEIDPASLAVKGATKVVAQEALARVIPALGADAPLDAMPEVGAEHVVAGADGDAYAVALKDGYLTWRGRDAADGVRLWPMTKDVEAPRAVRAAPGGGWVVVFRKEGEIWLGTVDVDRSAVRPGLLTRVSDPALQVGAPSIDARGDDVIATWAQRDGRDGGKWTVRWGRWHRGARVGGNHTITAPEGAMAPSVAVLDAGRALVAWTEGTTRHRVRAQRFGADDRAIGDAFDVSPRDVDAGQARVVVGADGQGAAGYLVAHARAFDLVATGVSCW